MILIDSVSPGVSLVGDDSQAWTQAFAGVPHDVYHTLAYHQCSGFGTIGRPFLFSFRENGRRFLWPYVLRELAHVPGCTSLDAYDVTSVYGYPGPLLAGEEADPGFLHRAWIALWQVWESQRVVSAFTRFHPILGATEQFPATEPLMERSSALPPSLSGGISECGAIVSVDLTLSAEEQFRRYRKTLRQAIRRLRRSGFSTFHDTDWRYADTLIELYNDTMQRLSASSFYLIDNEWLLRLRAALGDQVHLLVTHNAGQVASVLLALEYRHQVHAHLTGTHPDFIQMSPLKLLLDQTRLWAFKRGNERFLLGGGLGGSRDSLFNFKAAFSPESHLFRLGRWIIDPATYETATRLRQRFALGCGEEWQPGSFFPTYRASALASSTARNSAHGTKEDPRTSPILKDVS